MGQERGRHGVARGPLTQPSPTTRSQTPNALPHPAANDGGLGLPRVCLGLLRGRDPPTWVSCVKNGLFDGFTFRWKPTIGGCDQDGVFVHRKRGNATGFWPHAHRQYESDRRLRSCDTRRPNDHISGHGHGSVDLHSYQRDRHQSWPELQHLTLEKRLSPYTSLAHAQSGSGRFSTTLFMTRVELSRWTPGSVEIRSS